MRQFYAKHFIPKMPADVQITPIERNVGVDANGGESVVDEFLFRYEGASMAGTGSVWAENDASRVADLTM